MHSLFYPCQFYVKVTFFLFPSTYNFKSGNYSVFSSPNFSTAGILFSELWLSHPIFHISTIILCKGTHASHLYGNQDVGSTKMVLLESPLEQKN